MISLGSTLGRYTLVELITEHVSTEPGHYPVHLWRGHDETLGREVSIRLIRSDDARISAVLGAAQAAARAEDRRLLRILDVLSIGATFDDPAYTAIISEWSAGTPLDQALAERDGEPFDADFSLDHVANIAWALNAALGVNLVHGRLRPSCVFITESNEIAVRGLAVDYALFGPLFPRSADDESSKNDVDALGALLYCFTTGLWPYPVNATVTPEPLHVPFTPKAGKNIPLPSSIRASVPRGVDDVVSRSVIGVQKGRGVTRIQDSLGFANAIASARDYVTPVSTTTVRGPVMSTPNTPMTYIKRGLAALIAVAVVTALLVMGISLLNSPRSTTADSVPAGTSGLTPEEATEILTSPATPYIEVEVSTTQGFLPISDVRSFDPRGGDGQGGDGQGVDGVEREKLAPLAIDGDLISAWLTKKYPTRTVGAKGGVGVIVDLGEQVNVQGVALNLVGYGTDVQVRVSDEVQPDPDLWTKLVSIDNAGPQIDLRAPRPVTGRYVLIWLTGLPATDNPEVFQGGISNISVMGTPVGTDASEPPGQ
ncbi:MAG: hypothetical protein K9G12_07560 [Candidatus Nanopelagicales bacterium]|nr:hypothetical protein [Candidatus Nanopelagicales bacterium]